MYNKQCFTNLSDNQHLMRLWFHQLSMEKSNGQVYAHSDSAESVFFHIKTLTTQDASKAKIYYYTGDQFGNSEATAYIQAKSSVHFITLSARSAKTFHDALPAFDALVTSYEDLTKPPAEVRSFYR
jgi:hypothetical protein